MDKKLCECGCGQEVKVYDGKSNKYINGHNSRGKTWKCTNPERKIVDGYVFIRKPDHPSAQSNYVPEHRFIMEEYLGRYLEPEEISHHIDEIRDHNWIENLELCLRSTHASHHHTGRKRPQETKDKIAKKLKGNQNSLGSVHTEASKLKMSISQKARVRIPVKIKRQPPTKETREKMRQAKLGTHPTDQTRKNMSDAQKRRHLKKDENANES